MTSNANFEGLALTWLSSSNNEDRLYAQWEDYQENEPTRPVKVESLDEYDDWVQAHDVWTAEAAGIYWSYEKAQKYRGGFERDLLKVLPERVWVKLGEKAIAKYPAVGVNSWFIKVGQWE